VFFVEKSDEHGAIKNRTRFIEINVVLGNILFCFIYILVKRKSEMVALLFLRLK